MSIANLREKSNNMFRIITSRQSMLIVLIACVGLAGFGLGKLSVLEKESIGAQVYLPTNYNIAGALPSVLDISAEGVRGQIPAHPGGFIASARGSKYHYPWCQGAGRIKEENKVWFDTRAEAEQAGYTPAGNCQGL